MSLLNKIIAAVNPAYAVKKAAADLALKAMASISREGDRSETKHRGASRIVRGLRNWSVIPGSGRSDLPHSERETLIGRSYDAVRNHMVARAAATRIRTKVVGSGLMYRPSVDYLRLGISEAEGDRLNEIILDRWTHYANDPLECDAEATLDFQGICALIEISRFLSGDVFVTTPFVQRPGCTYELKFQLIDALRVTNPFGRANSKELSDGIETDKLGAPIYYYVRDTHPADPYFGTNTYLRLDVFGSVTGRRRVFHVWNDKDRIGAMRGTPALAPILEPLELLNQWSSSELYAALISSFFTVFIERKGNDFTNTNAQAFNSVQDLQPGEAAPGGGSSGLSDGLMGLGRGAIVDLGPDEQAKFADPNRPNLSFDPFFMAMINQMGAALEIPADVLMLRYQSSYSAARAAMLEAYSYFVLRRDSLQMQFCEPGKQLWMDEAVARGLLPELTGYADPDRRAAYNQGSWIGPARGAMDEDKEAKAAKTRVELGISNLTIETASASGRDWKEVNRVALAEKKVRVVSDAEKADTVNTELPEEGENNAN